MWLDLLGGLLEVSTNANLRRIPSGLPVLITGGADDPVGGESGMQELAAHYEATGHVRVKQMIFADGRHEMLNEINRDAFTSDLLGWMSATLAERSFKRD